MPTTIDRRQKIAMIRGLPEQLQQAIRGLDDSQLDTPYRPGGWTVRQVVHHLADSHMNGYIRARLVLTEDHPTLKGYDQERWAELRDARSGALRASLGILEGLHQRWSALLDEVPDAAWSRTGFHTEDGEITLDDLLETYSRHGANHVKQITDLRAARGW
jgi:hypothetical protein